jgi:hypothetical protein
VSQFKYRYREYTITIATMLVGTAIKVDTDVFLSPEAEGLGTNKLRSGSSTLVSVAPLEDILKNALELAKHTADGLAQQAAPPKAH